MPRIELRFSLPADPAALFAVRQKLRTQLQLSPLTPDEINYVVLAVEEACTNAIRHSGSASDIEVELSLDQNDLQVVIKDQGQGFDLSLVRPDAIPDPMATGGRGLFLMSRLMDDFDVRVQGGVEVRMGKRGTNQDPVYRLSDLIDVPALQELLDTFHSVFNCPSAIVDNEAHVLTASGWQDVCTRFHRINPDTLGECQRSDLHIYGHLRRGHETVAYVCPRGMVDCAAPIVIEGRHLGNAFVARSSSSRPTLSCIVSRPGALASMRRPTFPRSSECRSCPATSSSSACPSSAPSPRWSRPSASPVSGSERQTPTRIAS
jgi:anti-sigma regulatory factor (Ser/Thr protein kinase)